MDSFFCYKQSLFHNFISHTIFKHLLKSNKEESHKGIPYDKKSHMRKNYLNLTNGIEAIPFVSDYSFIRIQSTSCEQHRWDQILLDLDYDFLMSCALGYDVYVYDFGAHKPKSRALYQGLEFVKYVLNKRWYDREYITNVSRSNNEKQNSNRYFKEVYDKLEDKTKKKLDYFKPFLSGKLSVNAVFGSTTHDGDKQFYKEFLYSC